MHTSWAARVLSCLLRQGDGTALLGDLAEGYARRVNRGSPGDAARWHRRELYLSLAAVLRLRGVECIRAVPWGIVAAAYMGVGLYEFAAVSLLSRTWPEVAQWTSALRLVIESPGIVIIAYAAAKSRRSAAFVLGAAMLCVAALLNVFTNEAISTGYVIASLVVGPLAAVLGGVLHRGPKTIAACFALFVMTATANAQTPTSAVDVSKTIYGEKSDRAPRELDAFAFLIGKWNGNGRTKLPDGKYAEYPVAWIGRYILDGTAIADEAHGVFPDGKPALGITFRQYDPARATWVIEFLNINASFLRLQVRSGVGAVRVDGKNVTVVSEGSGFAVREHYLVRDSDHWVYRLDASNDGGKTWDEGSIEFTFQRSQ